MQFLGLFDAAQHKPRRPAGFFSRFPAPSALIFEQQEMRGDLAVQISLATRGTDNMGQPLQEQPELAHHYASSASSRFTRSAERCHHSGCLASARAPDRVMA